MTSYTWHSDMILFLHVEQPDPMSPAQQFRGTGRSLRTDSQRSYVGRAFIKQTQLSMNATRNNYGGARKPPGLRRRSVGGHPNDLASASLSYHNSMERRPSHADPHRYPPPPIPRAKAPRSPKVAARRSSFSLPQSTPLQERPRRKSVHFAPGTLPPAEEVKRRPSRTSTDGPRPEFRAPAIQHRHPGTNSRQGSDGTQPQDPRVRASANPTDGLSRDLPYQSQYNSRPQRLSAYSGRRMRGQ